ncbi:hypothetical protein [Halocatena halophila]|uniref:hypothetical protein n=1 Tax=Halocatena halophila TaxID=2814576 RepID=UPI002ED41C3A
MTDGSLFGIRGETFVPRTAEFEIGDETFVLRGAQIDELWERLDPEMSFDDKICEAKAVHNEVDP